MPIHTFIDTNVFLSFYSYSKDNIEELKKIIGLIRTEEIKLYLPEQVVSEFSRNRESKIHETIRKFNEYKIPDIPRLMAHYNDVKLYNKVKNNLKKFIINLKAWLNKKQLTKSYSPTSFLMKLFRCQLKYLLKAP